MSGSNDVPDGLGVTIQPYRFNGKESQKFAGLPYLDYGARFYYPLSSRWTTMDLLAEKYYSVSPYAFCSGNLEAWRKAQYNVGILTSLSKGGFDFVSDSVHVHCAEISF